MKLILSIIVLFSFGITSPPIIPNLSQDSINEMYWKSDHGNFDLLSPLELLQLSASVKHGGIYYQPKKDDNKLLYFENNIQWDSPAKSDWVTESDIQKLLPYIRSSQPCLPSVTLNTSSSCMDMSTVGKEACQIILHSAESPYPNRCSSISDEKWEKLISMIQKRYQK